MVSMHVQTHSLSLPPPALTQYPHTHTQTCKVLSCDWAGPVGVGGEVNPDYRVRLAGSSSTSPPPATSLRGEEAEEEYGESLYAEVSAESRGCVQMCVFLNA